MADGTTFVKVTATQATPEDYLLSGAASIDLLAVRADFNGSGAGGDFLPVVQIVNEADEVMLTFVGEKVTAGDSASVTFAPFLKGATATGTVAGVVRFDVSPQTGGFLEATTLTGPITLTDMSGSGVYLTSAPANNVGFIGIATGIDGTIGLEAGVIVNRLTDDGNFEVQYTDASRFLFMDSFHGLVTTRLKTGHTWTVTGPAGAVILQALEGGGVAMPNLPILDPGVSGQLWNNGGVLNISP